MQNIARNTVRLVLILCLGFSSLSAMAFDKSFILPNNGPKVPKFKKARKLFNKKVELGKQLFHDPRLSITGTISCSTCHNVLGPGGGAGADGRAFSQGVGINVLTGRSAPTVFNAAFNPNELQFWDGRAANLTSQAQGPILSPVEMGMPSGDFVVTRIESIPGYKSSFEDIYEDGVTFDNYGDAVESFEQTLVTPNSPFDLFLKGKKKALSDSAVRGMDLFENIGCNSCHSSVAFSGGFRKFPVLAQEGDDLSDLGRFNVTNNEADRFVFKVPTLRNIALTAPYFHNGSSNSLKDAVVIMASRQLGVELAEDEANDLVSFLESLTGTFPKLVAPQLPPGISGQALNSQLLFNSAE